MAPVRVAQRTPQAQATTELDRTRARLRELSNKQSRLRADKAKLDRQYQTKLAEIDRLKKQRPSWRRDRLIRSRMRESHGTASQLSALDQRLRRMNKTIRKLKEKLVTLIDRELANRPSATRTRQLRAWRRDAGKGLRRTARKIVLPEDEIDPLADPEELDYQASLLRQSEDQLAAEMSKLDKQAARYRHMVSLRKNFSRAEELARFDDDRPRRGTGRSTERASPNEAGAEAPGPAPPPPSVDPNNDGPPDAGQEIDNLGGGNDNFSGSDGNFDVVLADVVDASTIKALRAAETSSDPAVKAKAAERARKQVRERLERLRKRRKLMQNRAKRLRNRR